MGRILEALKRTDEPNLVPEPVLATVHAEAAPPEPVEDEMPFVEVGGPRKAGEPSVRPQVAEARLPTLRLQPPMSVELRKCPVPTPAAELIAYHHPDHAISQQYASLFRQIAGDSVESPAPALLFTSLASGVGTTTALLNLAIAGCKAHGRRIVVVDANRHRPALAARLGVNAAVGLDEVLRGSVALEQAVQATAIKDLQVLGAGGSTCAAENVDALRWVVAWLRQRFDLVALDAPPWESADLRTLLPAASAVYLVLDAATADQPQVRAATRAIAQMGGRLGGMIVTR